MMLAARKLFYSVSKSLNFYQGITMKSQITFIITLLVSALCCYGQDAAVAATAFNLDKAISLTLSENSELKALAYGIDAAKGVEKQAGMWDNPVMSVEVEEAGGGGDRRGFDNAELSVQFSQNLELGGKIDKRKRAGTLARTAVEKDYEAKRQQILAGASKAFIGLLAAEEMYKLSGELTDISEKIISTIQKRVDAGKDSSMVLSRAKISLSNVRIQRAQAAEDVELAKRKLVAFWSGEPSEVDKVEGDIENFRPMGKLIDLKQRLMDSPEILKLAIEIEKSQADLAIAKAKAIPDLKIKAGMQRFNETNDNAVILGFMMPLPIFDQNRGGRDRAIANIAKARQLENAAITRIHTRLEEIFRQMAKSYIQAKELKENVLINAEQLFKGSETAYKQGKIDLLGLLDVQRTFFETRTRYIESLVNYHQGRFDIEALIGGKLY
jgi:cobalt-zinc-cadmium efflux system outer membrane protein